MPPQIDVTAQYPGADALTIEQSVATPLEQQMNGVDDMLYMQSTNSNDGTMTLSVMFDVDTVPNLDQVNVQNRQAQAQPNLPPEVSAVRPDDAQADRPADADHRRCTRPSKTHDALFLANYANINILDALYRVPGVGEARIFGAGDYAMRIWVKPDVLARLGLTVPDLRAAIQQQSTVNPSGQVGANPAPAGQEMTYTVRSQGRLQTEEEFGAIAVRSNPDGSVVRLRDVARIELGALNYQQIGRVNGQPGCAIAIFQAPGSNALDVARGVREQMDALSERFPEDLEFNYTLDTTTAVSEGIREILITLAEAMVLVVLVVYLFLQNWRATLIPVIAVPVSLIGTFMVFPALGLLAQHAVAVRPGAGHRPGRRRRDRRRRGGRAPHRAGPGAARGDDQGDGRGVGPGGQHRADPGRGVHPGGVPRRHPGQPEQAVRADHRHLGADLGLQRPDAVAGAGGDVAAAARRRAGWSGGFFRWFNRALRPRLERLRPRQRRADPQGGARRRHPARLHAARRRARPAAADQLRAGGGLRLLHAQRAAAAGGVAAAHRRGRPQGRGDPRRDARASRPTTPSSASAC